MTRVALSTHGRRNPTKAVQPTCKRTSGKSSAARASNMLKIAQNLKKTLDLYADIDSFHEYRNTLTDSYSLKHGRSKQFISKLLSNHTQYAAKRAPSLRNAILHDLSVKAREAGEPSGLEDIRETLSSEEYKALRDSLTKEQKDDLITQLEEHRKLKRVGIRATNKSVALDVVHNANHIGDVILDIYERTGARGIALFSRGHPNNPSKPCFIDSDETRAFFLQVLGIDVFDVLRKLEYWSCTRNKAMKNSNDLDIVQKEVAEILTTTLRKFKNDKSLNMAYANYHVDIKHKLGVELAGWPAKVPMQRPSKMPAEIARSIRDKLRSGAICWVVLTRAQRDEVAEEINELRTQGALKQRKERSDKERSDKGTARGPRKNNDDGSDAEDSDDEEDDEDEDEDEQMPTRTRVRAPTNAAMAHAQAVPASAASVADNTPQSVTTSVLSLLGNTPEATVGAALAPFDPNAFDPDEFTNIDWGFFTSNNLDLTLNSGEMPLGNTDLNGSVGLDIMNPLVANTYGTYLTSTGVQSFDLGIGMPPLPNNYSESSVLPPTYEDENLFFPSTLSAVPVAANDVSAGVFATSTNLGNGGAKKRKSAEDVEGAAVQKKVCKTKKTTPHIPGMENEGSAGGSGAGPGITASMAPDTAPPKQRKKRSDAGVSRKGGVTVVAAPAASAGRNRKVRSDKGKLRGRRQT
ncbi:hypothetical protein B0H19DRAFT_1256954 [Mycena capillaripes]|nr:hypothetical protein B0H19DRAFT_1256954 [Mycena capillaripes]